MDLSLIVVGIVYIPDSLMSPLATVLGLIDLPLSLTADTVVLPLSVYKQPVVCPQRRQNNAETDPEIE